MQVKLNGQMFSVRLKKPVHPLEPGYLNYQIDALKKGFYHDFDKDVKTDVFTKATPEQKLLIFKEITDLLTYNAGRNDARRNARQFLRDLAKNGVSELFKDQGKIRGRAMKNEAKRMLIKDKDFIATPLAQ